MIKNNSEIDTANVYSQFDKHFNIKGNHKILFSGRYGVGKSFFLSKYFDNGENLKKYNTVTISPVNYVVSQNEDIFDLIKIDIIKRLYKSKDFDLAAISQKVGVFESLKAYAKKKPLSLVSNISSCLSKIAPMADIVSSVSDSVIKLIDDFEEFENSLQKDSASKEKKLHEFETQFALQKNSYLEYNFISQAIAESLREMKAKSGKSNVLIIEDFDRLDPAHIFRILNIFSAHSFEQDVNKFSFDKVLIVCDLNNIQKIYKHFYGGDTDFIGYIDKFYSFEPFEFDNRSAIAEHLKNKMELEIPKYAISCLVEILTFFVQENVLSLRRILKASLLPGLTATKIHDRNMKPSPRAVHIHHACKSLYITSEDIPLLKIIRVLKIYFESYDAVIQALNRLVVKDGVVSSDHIGSFIRVGVLPSALMNIGSGSRHPIYFEDELGYNYPKYVFYGNEILAHLNWSAGNMYQGDVSFFKGVNYVYQEPCKPIKRSDYFTFMAEFIKYAVAQKWVIE
jgi:hypothetical protein